MRLLIANLIDRFRDWQRSREEGQFVKQLRAIEQYDDKTLSLPGRTGPANTLRFTPRRENQR